MTHNQNLYTPSNHSYFGGIGIMSNFDYFLLSEYFRIIFCYIWEKILMNIILKDKEAGKKRKGKKKEEKKKQCCIYSNVT